MSRPSQGQCWSVRPHCPGGSTRHGRCFHDVLCARPHALYRRGIRRWRRHRVRRVSSVSDRKSFELLEQSEPNLKVNFRRNSSFDGFTVNCKLHFDYGQDLRVAMKRYTFNFLKPKFLSVSMGQSMKFGSDCPSLEPPSLKFMSQDKVRVVGTA